MDKKNVENSNIEVIVFTNMGKTYHFKEVIANSLKPTTQGFKFEYQGQATGKQTVVEFNYTSVSGFAVL